MNHPDLTFLLRQWPYEQGGQITARLIEGSDGRTKIQVRIELGLLQMELEGRPDGMQPEGQESYLEHHLARLNRYTAATSSSSGFVLTPEDCKHLREEALQFHHRAVALFALAEYERVVRDAIRNLRTCDLCREYSARDEDRQALEQFRPHIIMLRTRAQAETALAAKNSRNAAAALDAGIAELRGWFGEIGQSELLERSNEYVLLRGMRDSLVPRLPASQRAELEERLRQAIASENYELAAILRDELRLLLP